MAVPDADNPGPVASTTAASTPGICDVCGPTLVQREDDTEETVRKRLNVYESSTAPLIDYYDAAGLLTIVQGDSGVDQVYSQISNVIDKVLAG